MKPTLFILLLLSLPLTLNARTADNDAPAFNMEKDLLLLHFDLKTDVDDVHTIAATDLILRSPAFTKLKVFAVSGTYGVQGGLYVPADKLLDRVFGNRWVDAHMYRAKALTSTISVIHDTLSTGGKVWLAEAGQSDFTAAILRQYTARFGKLDPTSLIVVQHSEWNENNTSQDALQYTKENTTYIKIPDGNTLGNGTPGYNNPTYPAKQLENQSQPTAETWKMASAISKGFNGVNGRYLNKAIESGGVDFSDLAEVIWILNIENVDSAKDFFLHVNSGN